MTVEEGALACVRGLRAERSLRDVAYAHAVIRPSTGRMRESVCVSMP